MSVACVLGQYFRMAVYKAVGDFDEMHEHDRDHVLILAVGKLAVEIGDERTEFEAPHLIAIRKDVKHKVIALEPWTLGICSFSLRDKETPEEILDRAMVPEGASPLDCAAPINAAQARAARSRAKARS